MTRRKPRLQGVARRPSPSRMSKAGSESRTRYYLLAKRGDSAFPRAYSLRKPETLIGSDERNDFVIRADTVSRQHALITHRDNYLELRDLNSTNGTFVNGHRIGGSITLRGGDEISFGAARFHLTLAPTPKPEVGQRQRPRLRSAVGTCIALFAIGFTAASGFLKLRAATRTPAGSKERIQAARQSPTVERLSAASLSGAVAESPSSHDSHADSPSWLQRINYWRVSAGLSQVNEDTALSEGDFKHARYLVKNYPKSTQGPGALHFEDPSSLWYTLEGMAAGKMSDTAYWAESVGSLQLKPKSAIDGWMEVPFHRFPILNPSLRAVGYGQYCEGGVCAAALNIETDAEITVPEPKPLGSPVAFPASGRSIEPLRFDSHEWPNPLSACPGYALPAGLPITLQIGTYTPTELTAYSVAQSHPSGNDTPVEVCGFGSTGYANSHAFSRAEATMGLKEAGAIVLIPRGPLKPAGKYRVSVTVNGRDYTWSFSVNPQAEDLAEAMKP